MNDHDRSAGAERDLAFLNDYDRATRELSRPGKIMQVTCDRLGRHLHADRAAWAEVEEAGDRFTVQYDYTDGPDSTVGDYALEHFGPGVAAALNAGETVVLGDVAASGAAAAAMFHSIGIAAIVCCPLRDEGRLVAFLSVQQAAARDWQDAEVRLVEQLAERCAVLVRRARADLLRRKRERQFEDLFEHAPDAVLLVDAQGDVALANRAAEQLFDRPRVELLQQPVTLCVPDLEPRAEGQPGAAMHGRRRDGTEFPAEVRLSPIETERGPMIAVSMRDDSERQRLQEQLQHTMQMETIGQLAGGVAHDFNNLLTVINATAELLLARTQPDEETREDLGTILRACEQAGAVTRQLLALSRQQVLDPVIVDLNTVLNDMEPLLQRLLGDVVSVKLRRAPDAVTTRVDRTQIDQVLLNLALNSRDAMPDGGTLILEAANVMLDESLVGEHPDLRPGPHVLLSVSDTGTGMDEATRRRIFEPFFTTKPAGKGTGLGLATVYGVVRQSGGGIAVTSETGKGTSFRIYLPRVVPGAVAHERVDTVMRGEETVLVVEDEAEIRQVASIMLSRRGYRVLTAGSGAEALEQVREHRGKIDLVLSDVVMPGLGGPETMRRIRELEPGIRVLYMSGYAADLIARHGVDEDPQHFVSKPFTLAELSRAVRGVLDG